jgi:hypothetical protein
MTKWTIFCRPEVFDKCRSREGFSELVCLARCINALTFLYSSVCEIKGEEPSHVRERMNSVFKTDAAFQKSMRPLLKDKTARKIHALHLKNVRHNAVNCGRIQRGHH